MKRLAAIVLALTAFIAARSQYVPLKVAVVYQASAPSSSCVVGQAPAVFVTSTGCTWYCSSGAYAEKCPPEATGGGTPGGSSNDVQVKSGSAFGAAPGFTANTTTGAVTTKIINSSRIANKYATSGSGTSGSPYTGWETAITAGAGRVVFAANADGSIAYYDAPDAGVTIPSNVIVEGDGNAVFTWGTTRSFVGAMFKIAAGTSNVAIKGFRFDPGISVPASGLTDGSGGGTYIQIGTVGNVTPATGIEISSNKFGIARYEYAPEGAYGTQIDFSGSAVGVNVHDNTFDAAASSICTLPGHATLQYVLDDLSFVGNDFHYSQVYHDFGNAIQLGCGAIATVPTLTSRLKIIGNTGFNVNGFIGLHTPFQGAEIALNNVQSEMMDFCIMSTTLPGATWRASDLVVSGNTCSNDFTPRNGSLCVPDPAGITAICNSVISVGSTDGFAITGNTVYGSPGTGFASISVRNSSNGTVSGNNVDLDRTNHTFDSADCFVVTKSSSVAVSGNTCTNPSGYGFNVDTQTPQKAVSLVGNVVMDTNAGSPAMYGGYLIQGTCDGCIMVGNAQYSLAATISGAFGGGAQAANYGYVGSTLTYPPVYSAGAYTGGLTGSFLANADLPEPTGSNNTAYNGTGIISQGLTAAPGNYNEGNINYPNWSAPRTITFPDNTGTLALVAASSGAIASTDVSGLGALATVSTLPTNALDNAIDIATTLCSDGQILKKVTGSWACGSDDTVGSGAVTLTPTPSTNQLAYWTGTSSIGGDTGITVDATANSVTATTFVGNLDAVTTSPITIGSLDVPSVTVTTSTTGTGAVVLPAGSIDATEILDGTITTSDISGTAAITDIQVSDTLTVGASGSVNDAALSSAITRDSEWNTGIDFLVGTATASITGEIAVGTSPGGELGNTWASPTIDDGLTVATWTLDSPTITTKMNPPRVTAFPGTPSTGDTVIVTDDSATGACDSAAGAARTLCFYTGSAWASLGDGGSGSGFNPTDAAGDTTTWLALAGTQTGSQTPNTDAGLVYNASTDTLTAGSFDSPAATSTGAALIMKESSTAGTDQWTLAVQDAGGIVPSGGAADGSFSTATNTCLLSTNGRIPDACVGDGTDAGASGYATVKDETTALTQQATIAFIGAGVSCVNGSGQTDCTISAGGDAVTTNPLSQFAATSSAQLLGVLNDETGTGLATFATNPVFTNSVVLPFSTTHPAAATGGVYVLYDDITPGGCNETGTGTYRSLCRWTGSAWSAIGDGIGIVAAAGADTTTWPLLGGDATGGMVPATDAGLSYNANTDTLTAGGFSGPLAGNVTGNVSGTSGSTTGNAATVTTNANLTGPVTSTGNATAIATDAITDAMVVNSVTASNYLPLAAGSGAPLTAQLFLDNLGLEFEESDTNPTCAAGNYSIFADTSEAKFKKCVNGVATDMDTTGSAPSFDLVAAGTNANALVIGTSGSLTTSGSGTITATTAANLAGGAADQVMVQTASGAGTFRTLPDCTDTAGNHINYTAATDAFSCGTSASGGSTAFSALTGGTNTGAAMTVSTGASFIFNTTTSGTGALTGTDTLAGDAQLAANAVTIGTTGIIFEGATGGAGNAFEGLLTPTDPTADRTWTLPDSSGTFYVTGGTDVSVADGGTGASTLTDGGILLGTGTSAVHALGVATNGQIPIGDGTTDPVLATLTGTANEITVTNGAGTITIDIPTSPTLSAANITGIVTAGITDGTVAYADVNATQTIGADPANGASSVWFGTTGMIFEGATSDGIETLLVAADPTASDKTITLPNATGTVVLTDNAATLTNKTLDVEGTGNAITIVDKVWLPAAACNNATAGPMWDLPTTLAPTATCVTGTNTQKAYLDFPDTDGAYQAQTNFELPIDWTGAIDVNIKWLSSITTGNVFWQISTICVADAETDDPAFNTASTVADAAKGTTNQTNDAAITGVTATGCAAGELLHLKIMRDRTNASDTLGAAAARLIGVEVTLRRAQ
jgi:hypothetical protein